MEGKLPYGVLWVIQELLKEFENEIISSNDSLDSKGLRIEYARAFLKWMAGRWSPLDYDGPEIP